MTFHRKDGGNFTESDRQYAIDYINGTCVELVQLSEKVGLDTLTFLLKIVKVEAENCARAKPQK